MRFAYCEQCLAIDSDNTISNSTDPNASIAAATRLPALSAAATGVTAAPPPAAATRLPALPAAPHGLHLPGATRPAPRTTSRLLCPASRAVGRVYLKPLAPPCAPPAACSAPPRASVGRVAVAARPTSRDTGRSLRSASRAVGRVVGTALAPPRRASIGAARPVRLTLAWEARPPRAPLPLPLPLARTRPPVARQRCDRHVSQAGVPGECLRGERLSICSSSLLLCISCWSANSGKQ